MRCRVTLDATLYCGETPLDALVLTIYLRAGVPLSTDGTRAYVDGYCVARVCGLREAVADGKEGCSANET